MSQSATLNGSAFTIPDVGDEDWGQDVTDYLVAIPGAVLQKSGGAFTLTAEVDFGASYGLKSLYYKSRTASPASAGQIRLAVSDTIKFRNNLDNGDLAIAVDAADALTFGANKLVTVAGGFTFVQTNTYANQKGIRLSEQTANGTNYIELVGPDAITANTTIKLPDGAGSAGQVLSTDGVGALSWINAAGGGTINTGLKGYLAVYSAAGTTLDDVVTMTNTVSVAIAAHGQASVYTIPDTGAATANLVMTEGAQTINGAKTLSGVTTLTGSSTGVFVISTNTTLKIDSTQGFVSIGTTTMSFPFYSSRSLVGATVTAAFENTDGTNGASHSKLYVVTGGASGGDPLINLYNGVTNWSFGLDNSDSDALCWTGATTLNGTNLMRLTTAGALTVASTLTVTAGGLVITAGGVSLSADALTIAKTTNQFILGTTNTTTISATAPSASRVYTMPDVGGAADFVMTAGTQTIAGAKTFSSLITGLLGLTANSTIVNSFSTAGSIAYLQAIHSDNTNGASHAEVLLETGGASGGDPFIRFYNNATNYSIGMDNSDSDAWCLTAASTLNGTNLIRAVSGGVAIRGTNTNDSPPAGFVGEVISSTVTFANFPTTGQFGDLTSISLTAGDWLISVQVIQVANGATTTSMNVGVSTTSGNSSSGLTDGNNYFAGVPGNAVAGGGSICFANYRVSLSGTTTHYLKYVANFSVATPQAAGRITAVRIR